MAKVGICNSYGRYFDTSQSQYSFLPEEKLFGKRIVLTDMVKLYDINRDPSWCRFPLITKIGNLHVSRSTPH
jgi:hypothetical protein